MLATLRAAGVRAHLDDRDTQLPGWKYADWEMRGVPVRLEIGPKDVEKDQVVLVRRDDRAKSFVPMAGVAAAALDLLEALQRDLLARARRFVADNTTPVTAWDEFKEVMAYAPRLPARPVLPRRLLRGADQGGDEGHGARHPARGRGATGGLRALRQPIAEGRALRAGVLTAPRGARRRRRPPKGPPGLESPRRRRP